MKKNEVIKRIKLIEAFHDNKFFAATNWKNITNQSIEDVWNSPTEMEKAILSYANDINAVIQKDLK